MPFWKEKQKIIGFFFSLRKTIIIKKNLVFMLTNKNLYKTDMKSPEFSQEIKKKQSRIFTAT